MCVTQSGPTSVQHAQRDDGGMNTIRHWYDPVRTHRSLGSSQPRPGSLANLAAARKENLAQFFTPDEVARFMWGLVEPAMRQAIATDRAHGGKVSILDNSCGSGRLFQFADPEHHILLGADIHAPSVDLLQAAADAAGFQYQIVTAGMEDIEPQNIGLAIINPPFSIHLDSPGLMDLPCTTWGRFGPGTAAVSHAYALHQALSASDVVVALLATPYARQLTQPDAPYRSRLRAIFRLPAGSFREEGTEVDTSVVVYGGKDKSALVDMALASLQQPTPPLQLLIRSTRSRRPNLKLGKLEHSQPSIAGEVTGDNTCKIAHSGRKITLVTRCAFTRARVLNAVLCEPVVNSNPAHRYPESVSYKGQGLLDVEVHAAQPDPTASLNRLVRTIEQADAIPVVEPGLLRHIIKRHRLRQRQRVPLRANALAASSQVQDGQEVAGTAVRHFQLNPRRWGSARLSKGQAVTLKVDGFHYTYTHGNGEVLSVECERVHEYFELATAADSKPGWVEVHAGRAAAYPQIAAAVRGRMKQAGVHGITDWPFQLQDIEEASIAPGVVVAWEMGCGKTRALLALALLGGRRNAIVVEPHLVSELVDQIQQVGLPSDQWQIITKPEQCELGNLRKINILTYNTLRRPICPGAGRRTFARLLRRRLSRVLCDEAHLLRNYDTDQTRAIWMLSPRSRIAATGTPVANYARDMLGLAQWAMGDGTAAQPFGRFHPYMEANHACTMNDARVGFEVFKDDHCTFEWVTHEFVHTGLRTGAKREIPRVRNLGQAREWAGRFLLRRLTSEPAVAGHFHQPTSEEVHHLVPWDDAHLGWFLSVADEFSAWFKKARADTLGRGKQMNLVALLARIGSVLRAGTFPQHGIEGFSVYSALTSKQRAVLGRAEELARAGHKIVVYVDQPANAEMFARLLKERGIDAMPFHGQQSISARTKALDDRFRHGDTPVMVATLGVTQTGLNLYCADRALFACGDWSWKTIAQAKARLLRPQQTRHVVFEFFRLPGSLDEYQHQLTTMKADAAGAVVDLLEPEMEDVEFLHMDQIIDAFVANLATRTGMVGWEFRQSLKQNKAA